MLLHRARLTMIPAYIGAMCLCLLRDPDYSNQAGLAGGFQGIRAFICAYPWLNLVRYPD